MRITNKIIQRNNLSNINTNKIYQDKLSTQMSTQKKINRPSDDPVIAIRALRLRSNVNEITQYYSKNIPDAESWLSVTEAGLKNLSQIMTNMITQCTKGSNGPLKSSDRQIILEELRGLGDEVYSTGDADYAGRYVFTGFRTDTPLSFMKEEKGLKYTITEQLDNTAIDSVTKVKTGNLLDINSSNYNDPAMAGIDEKDVDSVECYRIRLAYNNCLEDGTNVKIEYTDSSQNPPVKVTWPGNGVNITTKHSYEDPYTEAANDDDAVIYVPETGELLLGKNRYGELMGTKDQDSSPENEAEIRVTYEKSDWLKGDLRPEHYFYCTSQDMNDPQAKPVTYNENYLDVKAERQVIEYDVGFNQTIQVNSTADECFQHNVGREVDDIVNAMQDVLDLESVKAKIEEIMKSFDTDKEGAANAADIATLNKQLDAVNKALTYAKEKEQKLFEKGITTFQKHLDDANLCITDCGTRSRKLSLIKNRMENQKTTFDTLKSDNEDVDITEVAINLNSAELTYNAALMATGKVTQSTLINYI
ncbi:MAG: hypothetical protein HFH82_00865 [Lachnospiraceae bacterium]|nr:hypothetical protein [Lachnospiraceae bacterium]